MKKYQKKNYLVYIDYVTSRSLSWIKNENCFEIINDTFTDEYIILDKYVSKYKDIDSITKLNMKNAIAKKCLYKMN